MNFNLSLPFHENSVKAPEAVALMTGDRTYSYGGLAGLARRISGWLLADSGAKSGHVGILASRTLAAYAGVLGTLWSGAAYVPINPHTPADRLRRILDVMNLDALIVDGAGLNALSDELLEHIPPRILCGPSALLVHHERRHPRLRFESMHALADAGPETPAQVAEDALAYIIFTSGTTGTPKGVMIEAGSVAQFRRVVQERCGFLPSDRVSQVAELTFDNSVLDMFLTWGAGAGLYVVPASQLIAPGKFVQDHELTIWFSVPSNACFMERLKMLHPGAFPSLRLSLFAGEALPVATVKAWQQAAPNSVIENFYGPTEVTVDCIAQRVEEPLRITRGRGSLAIGQPFPGIEAGIVDRALKFLPPGEEGELVVSGRQVSRGYIGDSELTAARFPTIEGRRWYRTGDLAYQDPDGTFHHLGRIDNQVKILGNRVELEEVEAHLREILGTDLVAAVAWPIEDDRATGLVAFHCGPEMTRETVRREMKKRVPNYMVPQHIHRLNSLPLGPTGKIDRKALLRSLNEKAAS